MLHKDSIAKDFNTTTNKNIMNPASNKRSQIKYADLQRQFIFLPFTTFLNCLVVMFTEVVTSNTAVFQEVLFIKFSLDYSYAGICFSGV